MSAKKTTEPAQSMKPVYIAKARMTNSEDACYDRIGVGFENDNGSIFVKLVGQQIVRDCLLYRNEPSGAQAKTPDP